MRKISIILILPAILLAASIFPSYSQGMDSRGMNSLFIDAPTLLSPITEEVVLSGKSSLEFRWQGSNYLFPQKFIFKLYKGYNTYGDNLILKEDLSRDATSFEVSADKFEDSQIYTWSLILVVGSGQKSDAAFSSFKAIKN